MKIPKTQQRYCPFCKKHTEHKVAAAKKRNASPMSRGSKYRARKRGLARGTGNRGRYSRKAIGKWKMSGKKSSKKTDLRFECKVCKKSHMQGSGVRAKRVEFV
ncbi:50S ribosomal protein L44e [Candidatus Woesearchaeota archaeon]|nr:50S ribosomal protein L44e [Candidatus Woesearchaeota archaeon]